MTPSECPDCTLFQFLIAWTRNSGLFWAFLLLNWVWIWIYMISTGGQNDANKTYTKTPNTRWLTEYIKTRSQLTIWFLFHLILFVIQLIEGYWILQGWSRWTLGFWTWQLENNQWMEQFDRFVMLLILVALLPILLFAGLMLVTACILCLKEPWNGNFETEEAETFERYLSSRKVDDPEWPFQVCSGATRAIKKFATVALSEANRYILVSPPVLSSPSSSVPVYNINIKG